MSAQLGGPVVILCWRFYIFSF